VKLLPLEVGRSYFFILLFQVGEMKAYAYLVVVVLCAQSAGIRAAEIRVITSPGLSGVFKVLGPRFERATGNKLIFQYGLMSAQQKNIQGGNFDVAIIPAKVLDDAIKHGQIVASTRTSVAHADLSVGVRTGGVKPDLSSVDAFKQAMLAAKSVVYVANESTGQHIAMDFERLGIADAMKAKIKLEKTILRVWQAVASGEAELGISFTSNLLAARGVQLVGPFPSELQYSVVMAAGIGSTAKEAGAAKAFIEYLLTPEAALVLKAKGLEPSTP
jgi:molybdate transport system substrate-binding protein